MSASSPPSSRIAEAERQLADIDASLRYLYDQSPDGVVIMQLDGTTQINDSGMKIMSLGPADPSAAPDESWKDTWGFYRLDGTKVRPEETGGFRAMIKGEAVDGEELRIISDSRPEGYVISVTARPIPGGGSVSVFQDVSDRVVLEKELAERIAQLKLREDENKQLIDRLRVALDELSTPVLEVRKDVLVLPVIGVVDTQRSAAMAERLLAEVVRTRARAVVIDVTGLEVLDTSTADRFAKIARAIELLGAKCLLSGLSPAVAGTLVELGVRIGDGIEPHATLRHALETILKDETGGKATSRRTKEVS